MLYKHFIAALAVAFLCFIGTIAAQKSKNKLSQAAFEKMVIDDAPKAFKLAESKQLNFPQLQFFINYERENERNFDYLATLYRIYWQQLSHKDKLNSEHILFLENNLFDSLENNQPYPFLISTAYVIAHQAEFKKAWKDSLFHSYIWGHLYGQLITMVFFSSADSDLTVTERTARIELYLHTIKTRLPDYEPRVRAYIFAHYIYIREENEDKYFFWLNNYLINFETEADVLNNYAFELTNNKTNAIYKPLGIVWVDKAIKINNKTEFHINKAEIFYELGKIEEAKQSLATAKKQITNRENWLNEYYQRVEKRINSNQ